jgi:hypothetical protein
LAIVDLPEPDRPVNHRQRGLLALDRGALGLVDVERLPVHVGGAVQREVERAAGDGGEALAVDQDEAAEQAVVRVRLEGDRLVEAEVHVGDLVELQALGGDVLLGVDVGLVADLGDRPRDRCACRA